MYVSEENLKRRFYLRYGNNSNNEIAKAIGVDKRTVNRWFREKRVPLLRMYQIHYLLVN